MKDIEERLKQLPDQPGVYIMKDINDNIIYVGKAKSLRKRIRQYFSSYGNSNVKVKTMVSNINDFEYIIVENEIESLILESNLIKDNHPKYNIVLRDDKQYPYIKITINERFPRVLKTRLILNDGAKYFGPYPAASAVNEAIDIFERLFKLRTCSLNLEKNNVRYRPCLNYFIGKCLAPCHENVDEDKYNDIINEITEFLSGKSKNIIHILEENMNMESKKLNFEVAANFRDGIKALEILNEKQIISNTDFSENRDVIGVARGIEQILVQIFFIRAGKIIGREHYIIKDYLNNDIESILNAFIKQFYSGVAFIPREIVVESEPYDKDVLESYLSDKRSGKVSIISPKRGDKKDLVIMAKKNALDMISKYEDNYSEKIKKNTYALKEIQNLLGLEVFPKRIESYDISNISGVQSVASMVVFEDGIAKKSDYRKFKIQSVVGPDDYASMKEVLNRRFIRGIDEKNKNIISSFSNFPDLIMLDGGKGQVNIVLEILLNLGVNIPVCGLVKDEFHTTRGIIYNNREFNLKINSNGYRMIYKIQEEVHRFAINYHRLLRSKNLFKSELDLIDNIGKKRKEYLMQHFKSLDKIKNAELDELLEVKGINSKAANSIYLYFHGGEHGRN
ncbi:excinuclease ABC subunit UvrC [Peptoniphilus mikwangii]|uniref:excinuclease ABC subunit UvrC n=1 Tax=Peptoniphilus mikwangii TaxID=1354300 RepID=UPI00041945A5|nr:excinuclease ABC subunit UvrC [Peptoniphilus mikwangii]